MNIHDKLFHNLLTITELYVQSINYEYDELDPWTKANMSKEQFNEILDLVNTDWHSAQELDYQCSACSDPKNK